MGKVERQLDQRIAAVNLAKVYGRKRVVDGVTMEVRSGEIVGLLGPNGAGKTTSFYIITGLIAASGGKVYMGRREITREPMYRRARMGIGYLPQEPSVFRKMSVRDNLLAVVETLRISGKERRRQLELHLEELGLEHLADQMAFTLSGGERRRLEISRALVTNPKFLLMDEPFSGVDPISVSEVQKIVLGLKEKGIGVLITDHNVRETLRIVDRAYLLYEGKVLAEGDSKALIEDPKSRQFYLGEDFNM